MLILKLYSILRNTVEPQVITVTSSGRTEYRVCFTLNESRTKRVSWESPVPGTLVCVPPWLSVIIITTDPAKIIKWTKRTLKQGFPKIPYGRTVTKNSDNVKILKYKSYTIPYRDTVTSIPEINKMALKRGKITGMKGDFIYLDEGFTSPEIISDQDGIWFVAESNIKKGGLVVLSTPLGKVK